MGPYSTTVWLVLTMEKGVLIKVTTIGRRVSVAAGVTGNDGGRQWPTTSLLTVMKVATVDSGRINIGE